MTTARQIEEYIYGFAPARLKMDFDNVGHLIGSADAPVSKILLALDVTPEVVDEAVSAGAQCIVTHHPVIFKARKSVTDCDPYGAMIMKMISSGVSAVCMHTNLDLAPLGVNQQLALRLGLGDIEVFTQKSEDSELGLTGLGRIGVLTEPMEPERFCAHVRDSLGCTAVRYVSGGRDVSRVAVGGGQCGDLLTDAVRAGCDAFVTSDLRYNDFLDAREYGITLVDAGHFPTENVVIPQLEKWLKERFTDVSVCVSAVHKEVVSYI